MNIALATDTKGAVILMVIGLLVFLVEIILFVTEKKKSERCTDEATARVVDYVRDESVDTDGGKSVSWYPVFEYQAGFETIRKQSSNGTSRKSYTIGEEVEIRYNPDKNQEFYVVKDKSTKLLLIILTVVGVFFVAVGASLFLQ